MVSRLRRDAHLCDLPPTQRKPRPAGPLPTYGKNRIYLEEMAAETEEWQQVECVQFGERVTKTIKTFLATWQTSRGCDPCGAGQGGRRLDRVLRHEGRKRRRWRSWRRWQIEGSLEQMNKDVKDIWGADEQQVRNLHSNIGCFNLNLWMYTLVEAWAWNKEEEELVDRSTSPWDREWRRPSHADKRKALQREILQAEIEGVLSHGPNPGEIRELTRRLLEMAI